MSVQWNDDKTLGLVSVNPEEQTIRWTGLPTIPGSEGTHVDFIAGYTVIGRDAAQHDGQPATRFKLADSMGDRPVGRLVLRNDAMREHSLEWETYYDTQDEMRQALDDFTLGSWVKREARQLSVGDEIRTVKPEEITLELDFSCEAMTDKGIVQELEEYLDEYAPQVKGHVINFHGPGGGNPIVAFRGTHDAMRDLIKVYAPDQFEDLWQDWTPDQGTVTSIEIVPAAVRGGETGLAVNLDTLDPKHTFLDMDLDEIVLVKRKS